MWVKVDPENPPAAHLVALYKDNCGAAVLSKFDGDDGFYVAEDGWRLSFDDVLRDYNVWAPAPDHFEPHFMTLDGD